MVLNILLTISSKQNTAQKMKFCIMDFCSKYDQIRSFSWYNIVTYSSYFHLHF